MSAACREALERQCLSTIGSESAILVAAVSPEELKTFGLDNVSGFLLSLLDGSTNVEAILGISGTATTARAPASTESAGTRHYRRGVGAKDC